MLIKTEMMPWFNDYHDEERGRVTDNGGSSSKLINKKTACCALLVLMALIAIGNLTRGSAAPSLPDTESNSYARTLQDVELKGRSGGLDQIMCLSDLRSCDLSCLDWTIVLSMGRSGSTTVQQMISKLPGMQFYGEEGGLMDNLRHLQGKIEEVSHHGGLSWYGASDKSVRTVACLTQALYAERHGQECNYRGCRHGWKEIRYKSAEAIRWIRTVFPSSRIILNYRSTCNDYEDIFGRDCKDVQMEKDDFLDATKDLPNVFHMELEQLNNKARWNKLAKFLGYGGCEALGVTVSNLNRDFDKKASAYNPWKCQ